MTFRDYSYGSRVLGQGYSSTVYKAKKYKSKLQFALKIIKEDFLKTDVQKKFLLNEIRVHEAVKHHKNFVNLIQHGKFQKTYVLVMELCEKGSLADFLQKAKKLSEPQAIYIIKEVIEAYRLLYSLNVLHRDIKPGNILITEKNEIKLCDFGLSVKSQEKNQAFALRIGTPCFMAPEVAKDNIYTEKADIWSIGVTYFLMLAGQLPFKSQNYDKFLQQVNETKLQKIIPQSFSEFSRQFVLKTLNPNPQQRMSVKELFSFQFQNPQRQLNVYLSQKEIRSRSAKSQKKTFEKAQSTKNLDKTFTPKLTQQINLSVKGSKKTQNTQTSESSIPPPPLQENYTIKNLQVNKKEHQIHRIHSIPQLSPQKEQSPRKMVIKPLSKEAETLILKEMEKVTKILMNQVDFLRYTRKVTQILDKYFKGEFQELKTLMGQLVALKFDGLKNFSFVENQKLRIFKNYPLYKAWIELIEDFEKRVKPSGENKDFNVEYLENAFSSVILQIYLEFDKSIKTKLNASKLIVLDHLICLKDLLQMAKKGYSYFLKNSMLHMIMQGLENINIEVSQIEVVFTGISKKLTGSDYS